VELTHTNIKYAGIAMGGSKLVLSDSVIESGTTCGQGNYIMYDSSDCILGSFYTAALSIYNGAKVVIEGTSTIRSQELDGLKNGIMMEAHIAGANETSLKIAENGQLNFEIGESVPAICAGGVVNMVERPFNTGAFGLEFVGVKDELIVAKYNCAN